jgi:hypothetical protein
MQDEPERLAVLEMNVLGKLEDFFINIIHSMSMRMYVNHH